MFSFTKTDTKDLIRQWVTDAPDELLEMSRFDCHIKGLHSIVIDSDDGCLERLFFTTDNHQMDNSDMVTFHNALGIHSHRYDITLVGLVGRVFNLVFEERLDVRAPCSVFRYTNRTDIKEVGVVNLCLKEVHNLEPMCSVDMESQELHTVYVPKGSQAAWLVQEGNVTSCTTNLYTNSKPKCRDYSTKTADEVRSWVEAWLK